MYRIELGPDDIGVFRSVEEMATAIKSGVITPRARIYHQASDRWLPIEFHPHYKKALEIATAPSAPEAPAPPPLPGATGPVLTAAAASGVAVAEDDDPPPAEPAAPSSAEQPSANDAAPHAHVGQTHPVARAPRLRIELAHGRPRRPFLLALTGVAVAAAAEFGLQAVPPALDVRLGTALAAIKLPTLGRRAEPGGAPSPAAPGSSNATDAGPSPASAAAPPSPGPPTPAMTAEPPPAAPSFGTSSAFASASPPSPMPPPAASHRPAPPAPSAAAAATAPLDTAAVLEPAPAASEIVAATVLGATPSMSEALSPAVLAAHYQAAYAAARGELETGLRAAGFGNLFAPERLQSGDGVHAARRTLTAATTYIAKYRRREAEIEAAYRDSAATLTRQLGWSKEQLAAWEGRKPQQEAPEVVKLTTFLLSSLDSLYNVLAAEEGAYELRLGAITFQNPKAARAYAELKPWLDRKAHAWAETGGDAVPTTAGRILRAMGPDALPDGGGF
jgi:hypothetical protein